MRPRKATDAAIADIRAWAEERNAIPTRAQIAAKHGLSEATVDRIAKGYAYKTLVTEAELDQMAAELCGQFNQNSWSTGNKQKSSK